MQRLEKIGRKALSCPGLRTRALGAAVAAGLAIAPAVAAPLYWDTNIDNTPGAGGATPGGSWGGAFWSSDSTGSIVPGAYVANSDAVFAAGTDATGAYSVTLDGTKAANSLLFEEGTVTILAGSPTTSDIQLKGATGDITVASGATGIIRNRNVVSIPGSVSGELPAVITKLGPGVLEVGTEGTTTFGRLNAPITTVGAIRGEIRIEEGTIKGTGAAVGSTQNGLDDTATLIVMGGGTFDTNGRTETVYNLVLRGGTITNSNSNNDPDTPTGGWLGSSQNPGGGYFLESGTINVRMTGGMGWTKSTSGTVWVTKVGSNAGNDSDSNGYQVDGGRIIFTGGNHGGTAVPINVNNTGILAGSGPGNDSLSSLGTVAKINVNNGGTVDPGTTADTTGMFLSKAGSVTNGFSLFAGGTLEIDLGGTTVGTEYDRLIVTGGNAVEGDITLVSLAGNLNVDLINGFVPSAGDTFFILEQRNQSGLIGTITPALGFFAGLPNGTQFLADGTMFEISYFADVTNNSFTGGNDVALRVVPEPASGLILLASGLLLSSRRRRK